MNRSIAGATEADSSASESRRNGRGGVWPKGETDPVESCLAGRGGGDECREGTGEVLALWVITGTFPRVDARRVRSKEATDAFLPVAADKE